MKILYHDIVTPCGQPADVVISGLQKFIRRGMTEEAVRAAYELFLTGEELTEYLWKRLLVISAEDIGMGNPMATIVVEALQNAAARITRENPDYAIFIVQAVRYLCSCEKERGASILSSVIKRRIRDGDDDDKIRLNQRKPSKYKGLSRFGPEKNLQRINKFMKERPIFYKNLIQMKENFRFYLRCFYCITKVVILQFNSENRTELARNG